MVATTSRRRAGRPACPALLLVSLALAAGQAVAAPEGPGRKALADLFYGEARFHRLRGAHFDAIVRLDAELAQHYALDEPLRDSFRHHRPEAELALGELELAWRMDARGGRAMERLLAPEVPARLRNRAAYRLARLAYENAEYQRVPERLDRIEAPGASERRRRAAALLRGQALVQAGKHQRAAEVLRPLAGEGALGRYARYNLGVALVRAGDLAAGAEELDVIGTMDADGEEMRALRDKANLALGFALLRQDQPARARSYLERVRLEGPFSNMALLGAGWCDAARDRYRRALVPWKRLRGRAVVDTPVQEAYLALPYAFGQLDVHGRAAVLYGEAVEAFAREIERLDASLVSIREGRFLDALLREEAEHQENWPMALRRLPEQPETRYLRELMAEHVFQQAYRNYRDLEQLRRNLEGWLRSLSAFRDLVGLRRHYYEPVLAEVDRSYKRLQERRRDLSRERNRIEGQLKNLRRNRDPMALASAGERLRLDRLETLGGRIPALDTAHARSLLRDRIRFLRGRVLWTVHDRYEARLSGAFRDLAALDEAIAALDRQRESFIRARERAALSYQGYDETLQRLRIQVRQLRDRVEMVKRRQGGFLERLAVRELELRRSRLERYRIKARFAMAESYDRATTEEAAGEANEAADGVRDESDAGRGGEAKP